jgi:gas vesicle protein
MSRYEPDEDERVVVIEQRSNDIGTLLLGLVIGAGAALLLAPRSGAETRQVVRRRLRSARDAAEEAAAGVAGRVSGSFAEAREDIERRIEAARTAVSRRKTQLSNAVAAGRSAARLADDELRAHLVDREGRKRGLPPRRSTRMPPRSPLNANRASSNRPDSEVDRTLAGRRRGEGGGRGAHEKGMGGMKGRPLGDPPKQTGDAPDPTEE